MAVGSRLRHAIESQQFSRTLLEDLFSRSDEIKREPHRFMGRLNGQVMAALFYEPSTRTRLSFEAAMLRLGGGNPGAYKPPPVSPPPPRATPPNTKSAPPQHTPLEPSFQ